LDSQAGSQWKHKALNVKTRLQLGHFSVQHDKVTTIALFRQNIGLNEKQEVSFQSLSIQIIQQNEAKYSCKGLLHLLLKLSATPKKQNR